MFDELSPASWMLKGMGLSHILMPSGWENPDFVQKKPEPKPKPPAAAKREAGFSAIPPEEWPESWRSRLAGTGKGEFVWTYAELGADLQGENAGRDARRKSLGAILAALGHPRGTHIFWPERLGNVCEPEYFWSGALALKARGAVIMGSEALSGLVGKKGLRPFQKMNVNGLPVFITGAPGRLDAEGVKRTAAFLKAAMGPLLVKAAK